MIDYKAYIENASRTESVIETANTHKEEFINVLNMFILVSEMLDIFKRQIFYGKPLDEAEIATMKGSLRALVDVENSSNYASLKMNPRLLHAALGLSTEAGEIVTAILKTEESEELDTINFVEELGDINWYQAIALDEIKFDLAEVLTRNIAKLKQRFPNKFSQEGALSRDLKKERSALEKNKNF